MKKPRNRSEVRSDQPRHKQLQRVEIAGPSALKRMEESGATLTSRARCAFSLIDKNYRAAAEALEAGVAGTHLAFRNSLHLAAAAAYYFAIKLHSDDEIWAEFQNDKFWDGHSQLQRARVLSYALMYFYGGHQGLSADRARDHARALESCWEKRVSASKVAKLLQDDGGFKGLKDTGRQAKTKSIAVTQEPKSPSENL